MLKQESKEMWSEVRSLFSYCKNVSMLIALKCKQNLYFQHVITL